MTVQRNLFRLFRRLKDHASIFLLSLLTAFTLSACATDTPISIAAKLYDQGQYFESAKVISKELDALGKFPDARDMQTMLNILHVGTLEFERRVEIAKKSSDIDFKISEYKKLLQFRKLLENKFYSDKFSSFVYDYPVAKLSHTVAEQHYIKAESIQLNSTINYKQRADLYTAGFAYANYEDIESKSIFYKKEYATRSATELYQQGLTAERANQNKQASGYFTQACTAYQAYGEYKDCSSKAATNEKTWRTKDAETAYRKALEAEQRRDYAAASEYFSEAIYVYNPYGAYKDSQARLTSNDKKWRAEKAEIDFNRAQAIASGGRKSNYREAAAVFEQASNHYRQYGDYRGASSNASRYEEMGIVKYGVNVNSGSSPLRIGFSVESVISNKLNASYYRYSQGSNDFSITVSYNYQCSENQRPSREAQVWYDPAGNARHYVRAHFYLNNFCRVNGQITAQGGVSYQRPFNIQIDSVEEMISFEGDIPPNAAILRHGKLRSISNLQKEVEQKMKQEIERAVSSIHDSASRL